AERDGGADHPAEVLRVRDPVERDEETGPPGAAEGDIQLDGRRDARAGEETLVHREAGELLKELLVREEDLDAFRARFKKGSELEEMVLRHERGEDREITLEEPLHDLGALGDENPIPVMLERLPHRLIRLEFRVIERLYVRHPQHDERADGIEAVKM